MNPCGPRRFALSCRVDAVRTGAKKEKGRGGGRERSMTRPRVGMLFCACLAPFAAAQVAIESAPTRSP